MPRSELHILTTLMKESLAATYGAGLSNACVVDIGAVKTSVACVDEGLIIPDTRYCFNSACPLVSAHGPR
jgi:actin-related protein